jgi:4-hydroxy-2-oxovalerate aldolase
MNSKKTQPGVTLLETTLRDGSYAINFQFTSSDTFLIASLLERAGFEFIEIGHGIGLGASQKGLGEAAETDQAYLEAAGQAVKRAKFGMFCIPGIAELKDLEMAAEYGMGFVRVGVNVTDVKSSENFIDLAKKKGMFVALNFMKSYALPPAEFAQYAKQAEAYGADVLYIVDSAGGMLPEEVKSYFETVKDRCTVPLAFHAHNNLGLGVANSLMAVDCGASMVDCSLQGLGRSSGNAPTEMLVAALLRKECRLPIDLLGTMDIGEKYVRPLVRSRGISSLDTTSGFAQFHSSYMKTIQKFSSRYRVDPRQLIIELCKINKVEAPEELVEGLAKGLKSDSKEIPTARFNFDEYFGTEQTVRTNKKVA